MIIVNDHRSSVITQPSIVQRRQKMRLLRCAALVLIGTTLSIPALVHAQTDVSDGFDGGLSGWNAFGVPSSVIVAGMGNLAPCLHMNGDGSFDSGISSETPFAWRSGLTASFDLHPSVTKSLGTNFSDDGDGWGVVPGVQEQEGWRSMLRWRWDRIGEFELHGAGFVAPQQITDRRWVRCRLVVNSDLRCEVWIDGELQGVGDPGLAGGTQVFFIVSGRDHYIDNISVPERPIPNETGSMGQLKAQFIDTGN